MRTPTKFSFNILPEDALETLEKLRKKHIDFWLVGGFARDWLAGKPSQDVDVVAAANPWKLAHICGGSLIRCRHTIVIKGSMQISSGKTPDLAQRDFNANAIAINSSGTVIDPYNGIEDIRHHLLRLRAPLEDDPIRMLRGCRLAARLGWEFDRPAINAINRLAPRFSPKRAALMRTGLEIRKSFDDPFPSAFIRNLRRFKLLAHVFPSLQKVWDNAPLVAQTMLENCDNAPQGNWDERMAALLADGGNPPNTSAAAYSFLQRIKWNTVASNFGRIQPIAGHDSNIAIALLLQNGLPDNSQIVPFANAAQKFGIISIAKIGDLATRLLHINISYQEMRAFEKALKQRIESGDLEVSSLRACLYLLGMGRKAVKHRIAKTFGNAPE